MTASVERFSPQLLNDFPRLKTLFTGKKEIEQIDALPESAYVRPKGELYMSRWRVAWVLVTSPFRLITYVVLKILGNFSKQLDLYASHLSQYVCSALNMMTYGKRLLMATLNDYRTDLSYIFNLPSIKRSEILNPVIRENFSKRLSKINFDRVGKGLCHGASMWFNYLILQGLEKSQLRNKTSSYIDYARAIAKQFENGQPPQAALLQSIYGLDTQLLDIDLHFPGLPPERLPKGVYYIEALPNGHGFSYLNFGDTKMVWDSNVGLIEIEKPSQLTELIQSYLRESKNPKVICVQVTLKKSAQVSELSA